MTAFTACDVRPFSVFHRKVTYSKPMDVFVLIIFRKIAKKYIVYISDLLYLNDYWFMSV